MDLDKLLFWQVHYRAAVRHCELLQVQRLRLKDTERNEPLRDALWAGAHELGREAATCVRNAHASGGLLTMVCKEEPHPGLIHALYRHPRYTG